MKILGREPALWGQLLNIIIMCVGAFLLPLGSDAQSWLIAVASTVIGLIVAIKTHDGLPAAILGLAKAALVLAVGLGLHWSPEQQTLLLSLVAIVTGMFVRTQVVAPVAASEVP